MRLSLGYIGGTSEARHTLLGNSAGSNRDDTGRHLANNACLNSLLQSCFCKTFWYVTVEGKKPPKNNGQTLQEILSLTPNSNNYTLFEYSVL
jgi:hypothetical protein